MNTRSLKLEEATEFALPDGQSIKLKAVSIVRVRAAQAKARKTLLAGGYVLEPPERDVPGIILAPGVDPVKEPYNDETIQDAPDDIKELYEQSKKNKPLLLNTSVALMFTTLLLRGTDCEVPENGWVEEQESDGVVIPTDPDERYVHYLLTEILVPPVLAQECAKSIMRLSLEGADPEVRKAFEDSFRNRDKKQRDAGSSESETEEREMDV